MEDSPHADEVVIPDGGSPSQETAPTTPEDAVTPTAEAEGGEAIPATETDESGKDKPVDTPAKFDPDLDDWAEKTGRGKPENDRERKLIQDIRDNQREFRNDKTAKKAASELGAAIKDAAPEKPSVDEDGDPLEKDVADLKARLQASETTRLQSEYMTEKGVTAEEVKVMGEILAEKVEKGGKAAYDFWTDPANLEDWHTLAQARMAKTTDTTDVAEAAAQTERDRLAKLSKATGTQRSASTTHTAEEKTRDQQLMERWSK